MLLFEFHRNGKVFGISARRSTASSRRVRLRVEALESRVVPTVHTWTGNVSSSWDDAGNWDNGVPGNLDDVVVTNGGGVALNHAAQIGHLTLDGGSAIGGTGTLLVAADSTWGDGSLGIAETDIIGGKLTLTGSATKFLGGNLSNSATITETGTGSLFLRSGAQLTNQAIGVYDLQSDASFDTISGLLVNRGTFEKTAGTGTAIVAGFLTNTGTIDVESGTLKLEVGVFSATTPTYGDGSHFIAAARATLDLTGGINTDFVSGTLRATGAGTVLLAVGTLTAGTGSATLIADPGTFQFASGVLSGGTGSFTNAGSITLTGADTKSFLGTVTNTGIVTQTGTSNLFVGGTFTNAGIFDFQSDAGFAPSGGLFVNRGTLKKSVGTPNGASRVFCFLTNTGIIDVESGMLRLSAQTPAGSPTYGDGSLFIAGARGTLDLTGGVGVTAAGTLFGTGDGTILIASGSLTAAAGGATLLFDAGALQWTGGTLDAGTDGLTNEGFLTLAGDTPKRIFGSFTNDGVVTHTDGGDLIVSDTFTNTAAGVYDLQSDAGFSGPGLFVNDGYLLKSAGDDAGASTVACRLTSAGTIDAEGGNLVLAVGTFSAALPTYGDGSFFLVAAGATLDLTGGSAVTAAGTLFGTGDGTILIASGSLTAAAGGATLLFDTGVLQWTGGTLDGGTDGLTNAGFLTLAGSAGKYASGPFINTGSFRTLDGGTFTNGGDFVNDGTLAIGFDSAFAVTGNFTQGSDGTLEIQLGAPGVSGQLLVATPGSTVTLAGTLLLTPVNDYVPAGGDSSVILLYQTRAGTFDTTPPDVALAFDDTAGTLTVTF